MIRLAFSVAISSNLLAAHQRALAYKLQARDHILQHS